MKIVIVSAIWCPSCLIMRPRFEEVKNKYAKVAYTAYDIDLDEDSKKYNVGSILPVFILFDDQNIELGRLIGEQKIDAMVKMIEEHSKMEV